MEFNVCSRCNTVGKLCYIISSACNFQLTGFAQLLCNSKDVDRLRLVKERMYGIVYFLVRLFIKTLRMKYVNNIGYCIFVEHQCAQHSFFKVNGLWRQLAM